jgi:hypothetical protein
MTTRDPRSKFMDSAFAQAQFAPLAPAACNTPSIVGSIASSPRQVAVIDYAILAALITALIIAGIAVAGTWVQSM